MTDPKVDPEPLPVLGSMPRSCAGNVEFSDKTVLFSIPSNEWVEQHGTIPRFDRVFQINLSESKSPKSTATKKKNDSEYQRRKERGPKSG